MTTVNERSSGNTPCTVPMNSASAVTTPPLGRQSRRYGSFVSCSVTNAAPVSTATYDASATAHPSHRSVAYTAKPNPSTAGYDAAVTTPAKLRAIVRAPSIYIGAPAPLTTRLAAAPSPVNDDTPTTSLAPASTTTPALPMPMCTVPYLHTLQPMPRYPAKYSLMSSITSPFVISPLK